MYYTDNVSLFRFYKPFVIAAPILFVLMCIVYVWANIYFYMLVSRGEMDSETANFWIDFFRRSPLVITALDLIIGIFVARKKKEKHLRMIEDVHESLKDENKIFEKV